MKMKKMVGAVAVAAALAMGTCVPAFATGGASASDATENPFSDSGNTVIKAHIDNVDKNIRATVPLNVTVVFGGQGGSDIIAPSSTDYKITNIGEGPIQVSEVEMSGVNTLFNAEGIYELDGAWYNDAGQITTGNYMMLTYKTAAMNTFLGTSHPLTAAKAKAGKNNNDEDYVTGATNFSAEQIAVGSDLPIELGGKVYVSTGKISQEDLTDTLCTLKYTIAAAE